MDPFGPVDLFSLVSGGRGPRTDSIQLLLRWLPADKCLSLKLEVVSWPHFCWCFFFGRLNETHAVVVFSNGISKRCPSMGQVYCTHDYTCCFIQRWYMVYVVWKGIWIIYLQNIYFYSYGTWSFSKTDFVGDAPAFGPFKTTGCILLSSSMTEVLAAEENSNSCKGMTLSTLKRAQKKLASGGFLCVEN